MTVRVVTGEGAAARDSAAINAGITSRTLMQNAGLAAAEVMLKRFGDALGGGVLVYTGPGNNGGDGWVVASHLAERGVPVRVHEVVESRTGDAYESRAASRSGIGMVRTLVEEPSLVPLQIAAVEATAATWPLNGADLSTLLDGCQAVLIGPGLGRSDEARRLLETVLEVWQGCTVLDADAITLFEGELTLLSAALARRPALLTPHVRELARLVGTTDDEVIKGRFDIAHDAAHVLGASILLKGVPTVVTGPMGDSMVSATGTPALATAGSGDVLAGIAATLLAQTGDPFRSGTAAAWIHGHAAEIANAGRPVRGIDIHDVIDALGHAWRISGAHYANPVLTELSAVATHRHEVVE
jgi:NAD(P)H-hydrate epimerase